jgi:hypothetical protein
MEISGQRSVKFNTLTALASRGVKHDYNSLVLNYQRFGDFGYFLIVRQHFFPSV